METWLLVLITAFMGQSLGHPVGAGGLSTDILSFSSKESCEAAGKSILSEVKNKGRMTIDTTGKYVSMSPTDPDRHWIATHVNYPPPKGCELLVVASLEPLVPTQ